MGKKTGLLKHILSQNASELTVYPRYPKKPCGLISGPIVQEMHHFWLSLCWKKTSENLSVAVVLKWRHTLPQVLRGSWLALTGDTTQMGLLAASRIGRWLHARTAIMWTHTYKYRNGSQRSCDGKGHSCNYRYQQGGFGFLYFTKCIFLICSY